MGEGGPTGMKEVLLDLALVNSQSPGCVRSSPALKSPRIPLVMGENKTE